MRKHPAKATERLNPRLCRAVALSKPGERATSQWCFRRYVPCLPAAGEIVLFDRSWHNRVAVKREMGFCTEELIRNLLARIPGHKVPESPFRLPPLGHAPLRERFGTPLKPLRAAPG